MKKRKVYLIILDGFGLGKGDEGDAIARANKPFLDDVFSKYSVAKLKTDGEAVGLPSFQVGGSEAGHITIGAGRPVKHLLTKINDQIDSGEFFENSVLVKLFEKAKSSGRIHFMGLCSDGGIHSFLSHLFGLQKMAKKFGVKDVFIHAILDGRDVEERSALKYLRQIEEVGIGKIASVGGRFYGMDRDNNWDRVREHYDVFCNPDAAVLNKKCVQAVEDFYSSSDRSDYYMPPVLLEKDGQILEDDTVVFFNYRVDRGRQISSALVDKNFDNFPRPFCLDNENFGVFGPYCESAQRPFSFDDESISGTLGEIVSEAGLSQLRISETEKFNHVTFYFSGERKEEFPGEKRILVPSPKCLSYAERPEMAAREQTEAAISEISVRDYGLVVQNYANADLVGHSGDLGAAISAVEVLDECLARLVPVVRGKGYDVIITADHGNSDEMVFENGEVSAAHSRNLVPFVLVPADDRTGLGNPVQHGKHGEGSSPKDLNQRGKKDLNQLEHVGTLADVAPTVCELLGVEKSGGMSGGSLISEK